VFVVQGFAFGSFFGHFFFGEVFFGFFWTGMYVFFCCWWVVFLMGFGISSRPL